MPRYFFDIDDGTFVRDEVGCEFPDSATMRHETQCVLPDLARDAVRRGAEAYTCTILVRNECDATIYTATLTLNGVRVPGRPRPEAGGAPSGRS